MTTSKSNQSEQTPEITHRRIDFLAELPKAALDTLCSKASRRQLKAGEVLFEQDEPADYLYIVSTGTLGIFVKHLDGTGNRLAALVGKGEVVGEVAIMMGGSRSASVIALRDTDLWRISRVRFDKMIADHPKIAIPMTKVLASRLKEATTGSQLIIRPKVISFIATSQEVDVVETASKIAGFLNDDFSQRVFVQENQSKGLTSQQLENLEDRYDLIILCCNPENRSWTRSCTRQSDRICLVHHSKEKFPDTLSGNFLEVQHDHQMVDLFILYENDGSRPELTRELLDHASFNRHFHIRTSMEEEWRRWSRIINGRGVGLVLSGGGARAYAHLGVLKALREKGIPLDFVSGTSMGAIIAASYAMGWSVEEIEERVRQCFVVSNPLSDYTLPLQGLVRGRKVESLLRRNFGETRIRDLWIPFLCVSTNLTNAGCQVHDQGELVTALRASISLPGILPPVTTPDGVLVDGGVINNLPVMETSKYCHGPLITVDVSRDLSLAPSFWQNQISQPVWRRMLRPPLVGLLQRSGTVSGEWQVRQQSKMAHVSLTPPLGDTDIRNWKAYDETRLLGYKYALEQIERNPRLTELRIV